MELKFLGRGAAFNPKEGGNSAFFTDGDELFLIDCAESSFSRLVGAGLIGNPAPIKRIKLLITHTHADHVGALGTLAMYSHFIMNEPLEIVLPQNIEYRASIVALLEAFGCTMAAYRFINEAELDGRYREFKSVRYLETKHCDALTCYSLYFSTVSGVVFYSGDTCETVHIDRIVADSANTPIDRMYVDVSVSESPVHLSLSKLKAAVPEQLRDRVYCMHFAGDADIDTAKKAGFKAVELWKS